MAEMICPSCGTPSSDGYCSVCLTDIPEPDNGVEEEVAQGSSTQGSVLQGDYAQGSGAQNQQNEGLSLQAQAEQATPQSNSVLCPTCGMTGTLGSECPQCGTMLPMVSQTCEFSASVQQQDSYNTQATPDVLDSQTTRREISAAYLTLPNGSRITLSDARTYTIGRESEDRQISSALSNSQFVSRQHCIVRLNLTQSSVSITDLGSTNGTFVGSSQQRNKVSGEQIFDLPVQVWLGSHVCIPIEIEI